MTNFIGKTFGIKVLYGRVMKENIASTKVMEKNSYKFTRVSKCEDIKFTYGGI